MKTPPHLSKNLAPVARLRIILARLYELGYQIEIGTHPTRSVTNPLTRKISLRAGAQIGTAFLPLLAHELSHAERQGRPLASRLWFGFAYLGAAIAGAVLALVALVWAIWSPWLLLLLPLACALAYWSDRWRASEEIEAEAHELAMRALLMGADAVMPESSHRLGGIRLPYLLLGDPADFSTMIESRASELLAV